MALQSSGTISLNDIHVEAGGTTGTQASINDTDIRGLIDKGSGVQMSFSEWYGASALASTPLLQTFTSNITISASDLTGTGPAWVLISGGGGAGSTALWNSRHGAKGGAFGGSGGTYGFFISDVDDLIGGVFQAGARGNGHTYASNVGDGTTVAFGQSGAAGSASTFALDGTTYYAMGGGGGIYNRNGYGTTGATGTSFASGGTPLTKLSVSDINTASDNYWGDLQYELPDGTLANASGAISLTASGGGYPGNASAYIPNNGSNVFLTAVSGPGYGGKLQIEYQDQ